MLLAAYPGSREVCQTDPLVQHHAQGGFLAATASLLATGKVASAAPQEHMAVSTDHCGPRWAQSSWSLCPGARAEQAEPLEGKTHSLAACPSFRAVLPDTGDLSH